MTSPRTSSSHHLGGGQILGFVSPTAAKKAGEGKFFISGAAITLAGVLTTDRACFKLDNPTGSGKVLYVVRISVYSSVSQQVRYTEGATLTSPTSLTAFNINRASAATSVATMAHAAAFTGGTDWPNESRVSSTSSLLLDLPPAILPPGKSMTVRSTTGDAQTFTANVYWYEE